MTLPYMPIMHDKEITVLPFTMFKPHEKQAQSNHWQSLEQLAKRGGLSLCEAVAILEDRKWRDMPADEARARIVDLCSPQWEGRPRGRVDTTPAMHTQPLRE